MRIKAEQWLRALLAAFITGASGSLLSALGVEGAAVVGININHLTLKQLTIMTVAGGVVGAAAYLKQSPVPPESTGDTDMLTKKP